MNHAPPFLLQLVVMVAASAAVAYVCSRLRILPIVGFLIAGVLIGPNALGVVKDAALIDAMAEIGVVLLLFTLGIELSLDRVWRIKRTIFLGGGLQLGLTILAVAAIAALFGVDWRSGLYTGALIGLSSTAIVLRVLGEKQELTSAKGEVSLGILIFQDLAVVALVLILPLLGGDGGSPAEIAKGLGLAAGIITLIVIGARRVMPLVLERVARTCSPEIFLLTIIAICLGTAWLTSLAGVSLSLGAFLAGLVVSESRFSHHAFSEILPLQILFSAVFFVSVGLLLDLSFVARHPLVLLGAVVAVIALKSVITAAASRLLGYGWAVSGATALLLAQIGEFSFVLERVGRGAGLHPAGIDGIGSQAFIAAAVLMMAGTPLLAKGGRRIESWATARGAAVVARKAESEMPAERLAIENHVIIAGYGSVARSLTRVLRDSGVPFVIVTLSPTGATEAENDGLPVLLGDSSKQTMLDRANIDSAKMLVVADDAPDMARRIVAVARGINPTLQIFVRTQLAGEIDALLNEGADQVLVDELEIGVQLLAQVLEGYQVKAEEIDEHEETVREDGYAALRSRATGVPAVVCDDLDEACFETRTFTMRHDARISVGQLAAEAGVHVLVVQRGEMRTEEPGAAFVLAPGDRILARASAQAFANAARLLRPARRPSDADAEARIAALTAEQRDACRHAATVQREMTSATTVCEECVKSGDPWVHLRICMTCGRVGCCDSSKNRHATRHFQRTGHPL
ncbi:MAG TPA: cation:proton antiporter, partial [Thermoanaerobaculia bacterium]|nr:cation:proton antiporter [Thermoanaerobaculia bacterium]